MPELGEQMYCSQQICIPPTFPYLLRQFAKAAIRTQPNDLLKWSCAYFRCLSLNIPPPVKPRLEYPIPRDHCGLTPGWLRALLYQLAGHTTAPFKVIWERWIGACLQHNNLIQILCLGGFDDNLAVPWLRFIALCAAHLTDNLTQSMILICEILTEEPEGGSAMIPLSIFLDLYQFLARIDASIPQTLKNYYFLDKFLELYQEKIARDQRVKIEDSIIPEETISVESSEMSEKSEKERRKEDGTSVISCPSVTSQDPDNFIKLLMKIQREGQEEEEEGDECLPPPPAVALDMASPSAESILKQEMMGEEEESDDELKTKQVEAVESVDTKKSLPTPEGSKKSLEIPEQEEVEKVMDKCLKEDLERLKALQKDMMGGESDDELEKYKASILADIPPTDSQLAAPEHYRRKTGEDESGSSVTITTRSDGSSSSGSSLKEPPPYQVEYEDVFVEAIPGIGGRVPEEMIRVVCNYMKKVALYQHDMVMPRNIRHFECPPLEVIKLD